MSSLINKVWCISFLMVVLTLDVELMSLGIAQAYSQLIEPHECAVLCTVVLSIRIFLNSGLVINILRLYC